MGKDNQSKKFLSIYTSYDALKYIIAYGIDHVVLAKILGTKSERGLAYPLEMIGQYLEQDVSCMRITESKSSNITQERNVCDPKDQMANCVYSYYGLMAGGIGFSDQIQYCADCFDQIQKGIGERLPGFENKYPEPILCEEFEGDEKKYWETFIALCEERGVFERKYHPNDKEWEISVVSNDTLQGLRKAVKDEKQLVDMLNFFSDFTLLSPFGYFLRKRISDRQSRPIIVTNNALYSGLANESIFRVLKAIQQKSEIRFADDNQLLTPIHIYYNSARQPWLHALDNQTLVSKPLFTGIYIKLENPSFAFVCNQALFTHSSLTINGEKGCVPIALSEKHHILTFEKAGQKITLRLQDAKSIVEETSDDPSVLWTVKIDRPMKDHVFHLLLSPENKKYLPYRIERESRNRIFKFEEGETRGKIAVYNPFEGTMQCEDTVYSIMTPDEEWYWDWVRSFGECGYSEDKCQDGSRVNLYAGKEGKGRESRHSDFINSLLNPYNSICFSEAIKEISNTVEELPPTNLEIFWLQYILKQYPNLTRCFLTDEEYNALVRVTEAYCLINNDKNYFNPFEMEHAIEIQCHDIEVGPSYRDIRFVLEAINRNVIWKYQYKGRNQLMYPYGIKYHAERHQFRIMAYSIIEKRLVAIVMDKEFRGKAYSEDFHSDKANDLANNLSKLDVIYFKCSDIVRRLEIESTPVSQLSQSEIWEESIEGDPVIKKLNQSGCKIEGIGPFFKRKKVVLYLKWLWKESIDTEMLYSRLRKEYDDLNKWLKAHSRFGEKSNFAKESYSHVISKDNHAFYTEMEFKHRLMVLVLMNRYLDIIGLDTTIIHDEPMTLMKKNIEYLSNVLMIQTICFVPTVPVSCMLVDQINQEFEDYNCTLTDKKGRLTFTLTFQRYDYRKIQKGLMLLSDRIRVVAPEKEARLFSGRVEETKRVNDLMDKALADSK